MNFKIAGIGEILWDLLPAGKQLGGAPANFVYHAQALGAKGTVISRVGSDAPGGEIIERLKQIGLSTECIELDSQAPTGTVSVELASDGQPAFIIHENVAWDNLAGEGPHAPRAVLESDVLCFGTLAQRNETSRKTIYQLLKISREAALRIFDINLRQNFFNKEIIERSLRHANILKINDQELPVLASMFELEGDTRNQLSALAERYDLHTIALTRGSRGSLLYSSGQWSDHPGIATTVADTIGAGDSFTAALAIGTLRQWELAKINEFANQVASFVASQPGATPPLPDYLRSFAPG